MGWHQSHRAHQSHWSLAISATAGRLCQVCLAMRTSMPTAASCARRPREKRFVSVCADLCSTRFERFRFGVGLATLRFGSVRFFCFMICMSAIYCVSSIWQFCDWRIMPPGDPQQVCRWQARAAAQGGVIQSATDSTLPHQDGRV